ncbi:hypothetical protein MASR2M15_16050 [Anaerolineales bacterium]
MGTSKISLAALKVMEPLKINRHAQFVEHETTLILEQYGLCLPNFDGYHTMSSYLFPEANAERLSAIILLNDWLFYLDDMFDRNVDPSRNRKAYFLQLAGVIKTGQGDETDSAQAFAIYLHRLFGQISNPYWLRRFIMNTEDHLKAASKGIDELLDEYRGDELIHEFIQLRMADSGMKPTCDLIEFAHDIYLPDAVWQHEVVREARNLCVNIGGLMNDIFSYEKEVMELSSEFNLVALLERIGMPFDEAVEEAIRHINLYMAKFHALKAQLPDEENVALYYQGLSDQIGAAYHWQLATSRYKSESSPYLELTI